MGPRHELSTAQYGWSQGHIFGVVGSTDHHNGFPGSYGYGRLAVWADSLTRDGIWDAITRRRTYALTGDRIELEFSLNGHIIGAVSPAAAERWIDVSVRGGNSIDYIEVLHNNHIIHRENVFPTQVSTGKFKIYIEVGWGRTQSRRRSGTLMWRFTMEPCVKLNLVFAAMVPRHPPTPIRISPIRD